mmetsp:Transcript_117141/g.331512  ORF Transcript_117141/g.331512 Transcript_117141/m.331512 type:complete len:200 (-) Transcript_117141:13-612(-)
MSNWAEVLVSPWKKQKVPVSFSTSRKVVDFVIPFIDSGTSITLMSSRPCKFTTIEPFRCLINHCKYSRARMRSAMVPAMYATLPTYSRMQPLARASFLRVLPSLPKAKESSSFPSGSVSTPQGAGQWKSPTSFVKNCGNLVSTAPITFNSVPALPRSAPKIAMPSTSSKSNKDLLSTKKMSVSQSSSSLLSVFRLSPMT